MKSYQPLALGLVDEGRLIVRANADLLDVQHRLMKYVAKHGKLAAKAVAKLQIEVSLRVENPNEAVISVKAGTKVTLPNRPASVTLAIGDEDDAGNGRLFVRKSGSDATTPRQGKFCTDDGERIDPDTGEVLSEAEGAAGASEASETTAAGKPKTADAAG